LDRPPRFTNQGRAFYFSGRFRGWLRVAPTTNNFISVSQKSKPPRLQVEKPRPGHFGTKAVSKFQRPSNGFYTATPLLSAEATDAMVIFETSKNS
jgi:hypothetical protein